ncbi:amino acid ABC transporter permease [Pelagibius sp. Alg239-R121]|uniref:amino acid ABC transporter permease n=1 Tax=Pelagibius sp. Alg239-R121 TaxID=2993448 RepID=UPI0024A69EEF|nr:amino acid ABC transporter permease [Pelagibius sp. Alg239-R121]
MATQTVDGPKRGSFLSDQRTRAILFQGLAFFLVVVFFVYIGTNTARNLEALGISTGFDFLNAPAGYDVAMSLIPYTATDTHGRVFFVGLLNTLSVAATGIFAATILGVILGVLRLSKNWLVSKLVYCYVEVVRNIPLLLQILFWYAVLITLPHPKKSIIFLNDSIFLNKRGLYMPEPLTGDGFGLILIALLVALIIVPIMSRMAKKRQEATGQIFPVFLTSVGLIIGLPLLAAIVTGFPVTFEYPELKGFNFKGGMVLRPEFVALWFALTVYTAAFIAEIVRAGIQAVSHGQSEAAFSLGLKPSWTTRMIILPQALRVIVPPLTSQYLNLTKNSSLAIAIGYPDLVATFGGTSLNQTGQAIEVIMITMLVYLSISLLISMMMNYYNKRIALVER